MKTGSNKWGYSSTKIYRLMVRLFLLFIFEIPWMVGVNNLDKILRKQFSRSLQGIWLHVDHNISRFGHIDRGFGTHVQMAELRTPILKIPWMVGGNNFALPS